MNDGLIDLFEKHLDLYLEQNSHVKDPTTTSELKYAASVEGSLHALLALLDEYHNDMVKTGMAKKFSHQFNRIGGLIARGRGVIDFEQK